MKTRRLGPAIIKASHPRPSHLRMWTTTTATTRASSQPSPVRSSQRVRQSPIYTLYSQLSHPLLSLCAPFLDNQPPPIPRYFVCPPPQASYPLILLSDRSALSPETLAAIQQMNSDEEDPVQVQHAAGRGAAPSLPPLRRSPRPPEAGSKRPPPTSPPGTYPYFRLEPPRSHPLTSLPLREQATEQEGHPHDAHPNSGPPCCQLIPEDDSSEKGSYRRTEFEVPVS